MTNINLNLTILTREEKELEEEVRKLKLKVDNLLLIGKGDGSGGKDFDYHRYLEKSVFMDFHAGYTKEIENIYIKIDELRKWLEDIMELLKKFATKDELKQPEGF